MAQPVTHLRYRITLRAKVTLLVMVVLLTPPLLVLVWWAVERKYQSSMENNAAFAADEVSRALDAQERPAPAAAATGTGRIPASFSGESTVQERRANRVGALARTHRVRIRILDESKQISWESDFDRITDFSETAADVVLGRQYGRETLALGEGAGDLADRPEVIEAIARGVAGGCRESGDSAVVLCYGVRTRRGQFGREVIYVEDAAERRSVVLYALGVRLGRLTVIVLPFAMLLAWWMGRRLVRPMESLKEQVRTKLDQNRPKPDLAVKSSDETWDLAAAFNDLLRQLEDRRKDSEGFAADLVHEFKNPLATVQTCAESLATTAPTPERTQRIARLLQESAGRLERLVQQYLELARAEAGMVHEEWEAVDVASLTRGICESMRGEGRWQGVDISEETPQAALVHGVSLRLESVLRNLIDNGAAFSGKGGRVDVLVEDEPQGVIVTVTDTGPGIAEEDLPRVFDRFFTTRGPDKGSGLGLALTRAIVEAHNGTITVQSQSGVGARFRVRLPGGFAANKISRR